VAEYYSVLKKAVGAHGAATAEARRAVYKMARDAIIDRLKTIDPPLAPSEISRLQLELEDAIHRLEQETVGEAQDPRHSRPAESEPAPSIASDPVPLPRRWGSSSPQDIFRRAILDAEARGAAAGHSAEVPPITPAAPPHKDSGATLEKPGGRAQHQRPQHRTETNQGGMASRLTLDSDDDWQSRETTPGERRSRSRSAGQRRQEDFCGEADASALQASARRSRLPPILLVILIIGVIGGAGVVSWLQRTDFSSSDGGSSDVSTFEGVPAPPDIGAKGQDRIADGPATDSPARVVGEGESRALTAPPEASSGPTINAIADPPSATSDAAAGVQTAVLYEEPLEPAAAPSGMTTTEAVVNWQFIEDGTNGPEVLADIQVPRRGMNIRLVIRRVSDPTLPASHVVEAVITTEPDFPGGGIRSVPRIVFRAGENDPGEPLIGAAGKVADGVFWIALSAAEADVARNLQLLRELSWIDLPLVYETGQRAILAFEKGPEGAQVFENAFPVWNPGKG